MLNYWRTIPWVIIAYGSCTCEDIYLLSFLSVWFHFPSMKSHPSRGSGSLSLSLSLSLSHTHTHTHTHARAIRICCSLWESQEPNYVEVCRKGRCCCVFCMSSVTATLWGEGMGLSVGKGGEDRLVKSPGLILCRVQTTAVVLPAKSARPCGVFLWDFHYVQFK
jgi:hypothetical protein